jgi:hypothetical protein
MGEVISLSTRRQKPKASFEYTSRINGMDKHSLLEEMVRFQENRSQIGHLTPQMMVEGIVLFGALSRAAETDELRLLTTSYRRHLEYELDSYTGAKRG